jgi:hypothetical protein
MLGSAVPMQATDLLAATGAAALGMLAVLHAMVWRAQRQRWALMFTLCMGLGSAYYLADPWLRPVGEQPNPAGSLAGAVLILTLVAAMADYVGLPRRLARRVVAVAVGAGVLALVVRLTGGMPRSGGFLVYAGYFTLLAAMSAWALRREPGRGHGVVLLSVLSYPLAVLAMLAGHVQPDLVRYVIIVPCVMLGMTVLTTGQMRERAAAEQEVLRRRAAEADLRRLNDSLELRVAARTAELQNMVDGLESFNRSVSHDLRGAAGPWTRATTTAPAGHGSRTPGARALRAGACAGWSGWTRAVHVARRRRAAAPGAGQPAGQCAEVLGRGAVATGRGGHAARRGRHGRVHRARQRRGLRPGGCRTAVPALPAPARRAVPGLGRGAVDREARDRAPRRAAVGRGRTRPGRHVLLHAGPGTYLKLRLREARPCSSSLWSTRVRATRWRTSPSRCQTP